MQPGPTPGKPRSGDDICRLVVEPSGVLPVPSGQRRVLKEEDDVFSTRLFPVYIADFHHQPVLPRAWGGLEKC